VIKTAAEKKAFAALQDELLAKHREETRSKELAQAQAGIEWAINATPTGEARNALTVANIFLTHAKDLLAGHTPHVSLDDLAQQVADERYDAAMHRAAESRNEEATPPASSVPAGPQTYPLQSIACPTHGLRNTVARFHEQRGTTYTDGSYDTRWHEVTACGCVFDVWYYHVHASADALVADSVTIIHNPS
jgi:hypothetical protein